VGFSVHAALEQDKTLKELGAVVAITGSNPLSTQDDVASALKDFGISVYGKHTHDENEYKTGIKKVLDFMPDLILDDGADLTVTAYTTNHPVVETLKGVTEETTTGVRRLLTEVEPVRALEAAMDGFTVMTMKEAAEHGDFFITATGDINVIGEEHFLLMKDGAVLANAGHFNVEIDVKALSKISVDVFQARPNVDGYKLPNGKTLYLLSEGRLVNLAGADGHP